MAGAPLGGGDVDGGEDARSDDASHALLHSPLDDDSEGPSTGLRRPAATGPDARWRRALNGLSADLNCGSSRDGIAAPSEDPASVLLAPVLDSKTYCNSLSSPPAALRNAMLVRLFGGAAFHLDDARGASLSVQRHRIGLCAILAVAHPRPVPRDRLTGLLWPDRDERHARGLLNQAVHALRQTLGAGALVSGNDDLRFEPGENHCDVIAFEQARAAGDLATAVELYTGPLLDGFSLPGGDTFERWLTGERERLRRACCAALSGLADAAEAAQNTEAAVHWSGRLARLEPYSAAATVRLMRALAAAGDPTAALREARRHALLARDEFDSPPSPDVTALAEELKSPPPATARSGMGRRPPIMPHAAGASDIFERPVPTAGPVASAARSRFTRTRLGSLLAPAALAGTVVVAAPFVTTRRAPALDPGLVAVLPFENRTGTDSLHYVGAGAADWVADAIAHARVARLVPASATIGARQRVDTTAATSASDGGLAVARETGAGWVLSGSYQRGAGDTLHFQVRIRDAQRKAVEHQIEAVTVSLRDPMPAFADMADRTRALLAMLLDVEDQPHTAFASAPPSYAAWLAYSRGIHAAPTEPAAAVRHFEEAVALDGEFHHARVHLGYAYAQTGRSDDAHAVFSFLEPVRNRLTVYENRSLDMALAFHAGDLTGGYEAARSLAELAPNTLPHVQWGIQALYLKRPAEALRIFRDIDPSRGEVRAAPHYWDFIARAHHLLGQHRRELRSARRATEFIDAPRLVLLLEGRALAALGREQELDGIVEARQALGNEHWPGTGQLMVELGVELHAHGHGRAAGAMFDRAFAWYRGQPIEGSQRAQLAWALGAAGRAAEAEALYREILADTPEDVMANGMTGVLAAQRGDTAEASRRDAWLGALRTRRRSWEPLVLRAQIAAQLGQLDRAEWLLGQAFDRGLQYNLGLHADPFLDPLRERGTFRMMIRPIDAGR